MQQRGRYVVELVGVVDPHHRRPYTHGVGHKRLAADLWSDIMPPLATDPNTALTQLDAALTSLAGQQTHPAVHAIRTSEHGHHQLNPRLITNDYHDFTAALAACRAATTPDQ